MVTARTRGLRAATLPVAIGFAICCLTQVVFSAPAAPAPSGSGPAYLPIVVRSGSFPTTPTSTPTPTSSVQPSATSTVTATSTPSATTTTATATPTPTFIAPTHTSTPSAGVTPTPIDYVFVAYTCDPQAVGIPVGGNTGVFTFSPTRTGSVVVQAIISERPFYIRRTVTFKVSGSAVASGQAIFPQGGWDYYSQGCLNGPPLEMSHFSYGMGSGDRASLSIAPAYAYCGASPPASAEGSLQVEVSCSEPQ